MPIGKISLQHISSVLFCSDIEAPFGSMTLIPFGSGGPERVTTAPSRLYKMIIVSNNDNSAFGPL